MSVLGKKAPPPPKPKPVSLKSALCEGPAAAGDISPTTSSESVETEKRPLPKLTFKPVSSFPPPPKRNVGLSSPPKCAEDDEISPKKAVPAPSNRHEVGNAFPTPPRRVVRDTSPPTHILDSKRQGENVGLMKPKQSDSFPKIWAEKQSEDEKYMSSGKLAPVPPPKKPLFHDDLPDDQLEDEHKGSLLKKKPVPPPPPKKKTHDVGPILGSLNGSYADLQESAKKYGPPPKRPSTGNLSVASADDDESDKPSLLRRASRVIERSGSTSSLEESFTRRKNSLLAMGSAVRLPQLSRKSRLTDKSSEEPEDLEEDRLRLPKKNSVEPEDEKPPLPQRPGLPVRPESKSEGSPVRNTSLPHIIRPRTVSRPQSMNSNKDEEERPRLPQRPKAIEKTQTIPDIPPEPVVESKPGIPEKPFEKSSKDSSEKSKVPPPAPKPRSYVNSVDKAKPAVPPHRQALNTDWKAPVLDLELDRAWFLNDDKFGENLPQIFQGKNYATAFGYNSRENFRIMVVRLADLATVKIKLTWSKTGDPITTLHTDQKFQAPPVASTKQLLEGSTKFGDHVACWCEMKEGKTVGDGECWTLAHDALEKGCGRHAFVSEGNVHGALILTVTSEGTFKPPFSDFIKRGDICHFENCCVRYPNKALFFGSPDHTAVVTSVDGSTLHLIHQNVNGHKFVVREDIDIEKVTEGSIKVYRPVSSDWIEDLSPVW